MSISPKIRHDLLIKYCTIEPFFINCNVFLFLQMPDDVQSLTYQKIICEPVLHSFRSITSGLRKLKFTTWDTVPQVEKVAIYGVKEIALALDCLFLLSNTFCTNIWYQNISWTFYYINRHFTFLWYCCKHHTSLVKWSSAVCVHEKMATLDLHVNWTNLSVLEKFFLILNFYFHTSSYLCLI